MQFKQGTAVFTQDGKEAGHIDRVVIDPRTKRATHIVVRKGILFTEDKVVPIKLVATGQVEQIVLKADTDKLNQLPSYVETHYILLNEEELGRDGIEAKNFVPAVYWYPPYFEAPIAPYVEPPYIPETKVNIPEGTVAVKEGAKVISRDDIHVGNVEQILTSALSDRVTHLVISKGLLMKEKKMIPVEWADSLAEDKVRLAVRARTIQQLPSLEHA